MNSIYNTCYYSEKKICSHSEKFKNPYLNTYHNLGIKIQSFVVFFQNLLLSLSSLFLWLKCKLYEKHLLVIKSNMK